MGDEGLTDVYVCECGDATCVERIRLTRLEYEAVRDYSTRFAIAVDHENPEIDQLVTEGGRYSVVQKIAGRPARIARQMDQRHGVGASG
jgi:3,4-dihydroxy-2-butanone 4-phosphate synthase